LDERRAIERVLEDILSPLLEADGGGIELVSFSGDEVVLTLTGAFRGDPGTTYVQSHVVKPAITKALSREVRIRWELPLDSRSSG
jgi:Fe-S cluster biogenesis protein NfuA